MLVIQFFSNTRTMQRNYKLGTRGKIYLSISEVPFDILLTFENITEYGFVFWNYFSHYVMCPFVLFVIILFNIWSVCVFIIP